MKDNFVMNRRFKFFSIKNKMIIVFTIFSSCMLSLLCVVSIVLASFYLTENTKYFLREISSSYSRILNERASAMFARLEAFSNLPQLQDTTLSYSEKISLLKNEKDMLKQQGWIDFGLSSVDGLLYKTDDSVENVFSFF